MATQDSRIRLKRSTTTGEVPTVAPSNDHTDGTWDALDVYVGELFLNTTDDKLWVRTDNGVREIAVGGMTLKTEKLDIPSAQVLTLNSSPVAFGLNVPSGYAVHLLSVTMLALFNSVAYATNTNISVRAVGVTDAQAKGTSYLSFTANTFVPLAIQSGGPNGIMYADGADVEVFVAAGNPTAGDSDITIYLTYVLIPI